MIPAELSDKLNELKTSGPRYLGQPVLEQALLEPLREYLSAANTTLIPRNRDHPHFTTDGYAPVVQGRLGDAYVFQVCGCDATKVFLLVDEAELVERPLPPTAALRAARRQSR